jgi:hypothetical protein
LKSVFPGIASAARISVRALSTLAGAALQTAFTFSRVSDLLEIPMSYKLASWRAGVIFALLIMGCASPEQASMRKALTAYGEMENKYFNPSPNNRPADVANQINRLCDHCRSIDLHDCPREFQDAWKQHFQALREMETAFRNAPSSNLGAIF